MTAAATLVALAMAVPAGDGSGPATRERLAFNIAADGSVVEALRAHLAPALAARRVDLDMTPVATIDIERVLATAAERTPGGPLARAWLDGRDPRVAVLFLIPRDTDRVLVRKVPVGAGFDAVALAEIAYIVERAVASLLAAEPIGVPPAEVRAALAQTSTSPPKTSSSTAAITIAAPATTAPARFALDGGAFAGVSAWAPGASAVLSVGLSFGAERVGPATRVGLMLAAAGRQSFDVASSPAGVHVSGGEVHLYLTSARTLGRWGLGRLGIGPGLVVARVEPVGAGASATQMIEAQPRTDVDPTIAAVARWDAPVGRLARPFIAATVDFIPVRGAYTAIVNGTSRTLLAPWPVRPGVLAGIAFGR